jgi:hypothetical protein
MRVVFMSVFLLVVVDTHRSGADGLPSRGPRANQQGHAHVLHSASVQALRHEDADTQSSYPYQACPSAHQALCP